MSMYEVDGSFNVHAVNARRAARKASAAFYAAETLAADWALALSMDAAYDRMPVRVADPTVEESDAAVADFLATLNRECGLTS